MRKSVLTNTDEKLAEKSEQTFKLLVGLLFSREFEITDTHSAEL